MRPCSSKPGALDYLDIFDKQLNKRLEEKLSNKDTSGIKIEEFEKGAMEKGLLRSNEMSLDMQRIMFKMLKRKQSGRNQSPSTTYLTRYKVNRMVLKPDPSGM